MFGSSNSNCYIVAIVVETRVEHTAKGQLEQTRIARVNVGSERDASRQAYRLVGRYWKHDDPKRVALIRQAEEDERGADAVLVSHNTTAAPINPGQRIKPTSLTAWYVF